MDAGRAMAVEAAGVWKYFGNYAALRDICLSVPRGTCLALLGRNGAGKTTFLKILCGLSAPSKGTLRLTEKDKRGVLGHGIGIYDELTAAENLDYFARLYGVAERGRRTAAWLERVGLAHVAEAPVREFSRGMRQRLALARTFQHEPELLLLDEPFTALDDRAVGLLQSLLSERLQAGATVIMSTHQLREAVELATHAALLVRGRIAFQGERPAEMLEDPGWLYRMHGEGS
jgi:heme ABC exporter ATP-binding subunit CcmA